MAAHFSVITGDLMGSQKLEAHVIAALFKELEADLGAHLYQLDTKVTQYRGDGIQLLCKDPSEGVKVMLMIKAWMAWKSKDITGKPIGIRLFLGVGEAQLEKTIGSSGGPAFMLSGRGLDDLKAPFTMGVALQGKENNLQEQALQHLVEVLDEISSRWKTSHGRVMYYLLQGLNYRQIAETTKVKEPTEGGAGRSAGWPRIKNAITFAQQLILQSR